jgi:hypothetical protein
MGNHAAGHAEFDHSRLRNHEGCQQLLNDLMVASKQLGERVEKMTDGGRFAVGKR